MIKQTEQQKGKQTLERETVQPEIVVPLPDGRDAGIGKVVLPLRRGVLSDNGATPWFTTLPVGKPAQPLKFAIDSGTGYSWVTSTRCTTDACLMHRRFSPNDSESFRSMANPRTPATVHFGAWGEMNAYLGRDFLSLKRALLPDKQPDIKQLMTLYLSTSYAGTQFEDLVWDGALALPLTHPPESGSDSLVDLLIASGVIGTKLTSFWLNGYTGKGHCLIGAVDPMRYDPASVNVIPLATLSEFEESVWSVELETLQCGEQEMVERALPVILDTGSSCFKGDRQLIEKIKSALTLNWTLPDELEGEFPDFDAYPDLTLTFNGCAYTMTASQYFMETAPGKWELAFQPLPGLKGALLAGTAFLESVYTVLYHGDVVAGLPPAVAFANPLF